MGFSAIMRPILNSGPSLNAVALNVEGRSEGEQRWVELQHKVLISCIVKIRDKYSQIRDEDLRNPPLSCKLYLKSEMCYYSARINQVLLDFNAPGENPSIDLQARLIVKFMEAAAFGALSVVAVLVQVLFFAIQCPVLLSFCSEESCQKAESELAYNALVLWAYLYHHIGRCLPIFREWEQRLITTAATITVQRRLQEGRDAFDVTTNLQAAITASMHTAQPSQLAEDLRDQGVALLRELAGNDLSLLQDTENVETFTFFAFKVAHYYAILHPDAAVPTFLSERTSNLINAFRVSAEFQGHLAQITPGSAAEQEWNRILGLNAADLDALRDIDISIESVRGIVVGLKGIASEATQASVLFTQCWQQAAPPQPEAQDG